MIKFVASMRRRADLTHEEFVNYHKTKHAPLFMSLPEVKQHVRRYVQSHPIPVDLPGLAQSAYDGLTEIWFDDIDGLKGVFASDAYLAIIRPDEQQFIAMDHSDVMITVENPVYR
jgi:uncharacterized protein (TIGR02118 family)